MHDVTIDTIRILDILLESIYQIDTADESTRHRQTTFR